MYREILHAVMSRIIPAVVLLTLLGLLAPQASARERGRLRREASSRKDDSSASKRSQREKSEKRGVSRDSSGDAPAKDSGQGRTKGSRGDRDKDKDAEKRRGHQGSGSAERSRRSSEPVVTSLQPETVVLRLAGKPVDVTVGGKNLDEVRKPVVLDGRRLARGIGVSSKATSQRLTIRLWAGKAAVPGDYRLRIVAGRRVTGVPIHVRDPKAGHAKNGPRQSEQRRVPMGRREETKSSPGMTRESKPEAQSGLANAVRATQSYKKGGQSATRAVWMLKTRQRASADVAARAMVEAGYTSKESSRAMSYYYRDDARRALALMQKLESAEDSEEDHKSATDGRRTEEPMVENRGQRGSEESQGDAKRGDLLAPVEGALEIPREVGRRVKKAAQAVGRALKKSGKTVAEAYVALKERFPTLSDKEIMEVLYAVFEEALEEQQEDRVFFVDKLQDLNMTPQAMVQWLHNTLGVPIAESTSWLTDVYDPGDLSAEEFLVVFLKLNIQDPNNEPQTYAFAKQKLEDLNMTPQAMARWLHEEVGLSIDEVASWLMDVYDLPAEQVATVLVAVDPASAIVSSVFTITQVALWMKETVGRSAAEVGNWLTDASGWTADKVADSLREAGYTTVDVARWLKDHAGRTPGQVAEWVKEGAGFTWEQTVDVLAEIGYSAAETSQWLKDEAGWTASQIAAWLKDTYGSGGAAVTERLKDLGFSPTQVVNALEEAFSHEAGDVVGWMKDAGYEIHVIADMLINAKNKTIAEAIALLSQVFESQTKVLEAVTQAQTD